MGGVWTFFHHLLLLQPRTPDQWPTHPGRTRGVLDVMIHLGEEELIPLKEVTELLPGRRKDRPMAPSTAWRWAVHGVTPKGGGPPIKLEVLVVGGAMMTSRQAVSRFIQQTTAARLGRAVPPVAETPTVAQRRRRLKQVEAELDKRGV